MALRIAMWSGPRNISTAMMRAWGNRPDTVVVDEPFYAFYLNQTRATHPGMAEVIAQGEVDPRKVIAQLTGPIPNGACIFYQKQMTHHLLPEVDRSWLGRLTNCFLIRDPAAVITSYLKKNGVPTAEDVGFPQQLEIFNFVRQQLNQPPLVLDADDVLRNPARMLRLLCESFGVEFTDAMLSWSPGRRDTDGVWAKYWYAEVERSTGFDPFRERRVEVSASLRDVLEQCRECYDWLYQYRLR